jgi:hypothetical protein
MKELVIFSSPLLCVLIAVTIVLHIANVIVRKAMSGSDVLAKKIMKVVAIVNMAIHVAIFVVCIVISASPQEMLFITMLSTAVAMAATNVGREE